MENLHPPAEMARRIVFLALIGFAAITLSGPIVAVLSIVLSLGFVVLAFAAVGFLVWLPFRILVAGHRAALASVTELGHGLGFVLGSLARALVQVVTFPARLVAFVLIGLLQSARGIWSIVRPVIGLTLETALLAGTGVAVGLVMGIAMGRGPEALATNAVAGGLLGALTGLVMGVRERRAAYARPREIVG